MCTSGLALTRRHFLQQQHCSYSTQMLAYEAVPWNVDVQDSSFTKTRSATPKTCLRHDRLDSSKVLLGEGPVSLSCTLRPDML